MDSLPREILLVIAQKLSGDSCYSLAMTSKNYLWLLSDNSLWYHLCSYELGCPDIILDVAKRRRLIGRLVYMKLSRCQEQIRIEDTNYVEQCTAKALPGCSFCLEHCACNDIALCKYCECRVTKPDDKFCRHCVDTQAYLNGCWNWSNLENGRKICGNKRLGDSKYCSSCWHATPEPREAHDNPQFVQCPHLHNRYVITSGDLATAVVRHCYNGELVLEGKMPPGLTSETITSLDNLIPLTREESEIATGMGITYHG